MVQRAESKRSQWQIEFRMLFLNLLSGQTCCFDPHNASQELSIILKCPECNLWLLWLQIKTPRIVPDPR